MSINFSVFSICIKNYEPKLLNLLKLFFLNLYNEKLIRHFWALKILLKIGKAIGNKTKQKCFKFVWNELLEASFIYVLTYVSKCSKSVSCCHLSLPNVIYSEHHITNHTWTLEYGSYSVRNKGCISCRVDPCMHRFGFNTWDGLTQSENATSFEIELIW